MFKFKKHILFPDHFLDKSEEEDEDEDEEDSKSKNEQSENDSGNDETNHQTKSIKFSSTILDENSNIVSVISQLSAEAKRILVTIVQCKELVKYVKQVI